MHTVSIVIAAYNEQETLGQCLQSILEVEFDMTLLEIIIVDNNSTDKTYEIAKNFPVRIVRENKKGASFARNTGIDHAKNDIIVFVDADVYVERDWLRNLVKPFEDKEIGSVGGKILPAHSRLISNYFSRSILGRYQCHNHRRYEKSYATCNLAIRREWLQDERFDPHLYPAEDVDLTMRLVSIGCKILYEPTAAVRHEHPRTISEFFAYWQKWARGRCLLCKKYPANKTCMLMRFQVLPFYYLAIVIVAFWSVKLSILLTVPLLLILYKSAYRDFKSDRRFFANFIAAPLLNVISLFVASVVFGYYEYFKK